jgi:hypothetical protein
MNFNFLLKMSMSLNIKNKEDGFELKIGLD